MRITIIVGDSIGKETAKIEVLEDEDAKAFKKLIETQYLVNPDSSNYPIARKLFHFLNIE